MEETGDIDLGSYKPNTNEIKSLENTPILLLVGPTGSGKDTIASELYKTGHFYKIVTYTTRSPRHNHGQLEVNGDEYYFIDLKTARVMLERKEFVEIAMIHGNLYGTSLSEFKKADSESKISVTDLDIQGVRSYVKLFKNVVAVFLLPPNFDVLIQRLSKRYGHSKKNKNISTRLETALVELNELRDRDYYYPVINDDLNMAVATIKSILDNKTRPKAQVIEANQLANQLMQDITNYLAS